MAYIVECLDCEDGAIELGSNRKVNEWIDQHLDTKGNGKHTVSVYEDRGTCIADIEKGHRFE